MRLLRPLLIVANSHRGETYAIVFDPENNASRDAAKRQLGKWAADASLDFTYRDAADAAIRAGLYPEPAAPNWWTT